MTEQLAKAFAEASRLSESEQDAFAAWVLEALAEWQVEEDADEPMTLAEMLEEARPDRPEGRTVPRI